MKIISQAKLFSKIGENFHLFSAQIQLTNQCNENCVHCLVVRKPANELTLCKFKKIICQLRELGCMEITFTGGEVMMKNDFFEILNFTKERGFAIRILSNGTLINEANIKKLKDINPRDVQISLYGATARAHDSFTRLEGSFEMTMNAIRLLKENKIRHSITTMVTRHNFNQIARLNSKLDFIIRPDENRGKNPLKIRVTDLQIEKAKKLKYIPFLTRAGNLRRYKIGDLCVNNLGRRHIYISNNGDIFPSLLCLIKLGSIKTSSLLNLWRNSKKLNWLRNLKLENFECSKCRYLFKCPWDPGLALQEHGSLFRRPEEFCRFMRCITGEKIAIK